LFKPAENCIRGLPDYHGWPSARCIGRKVKEKIMRRATAISLPWRANAIALALGLTIIGLGAGLAHSNPGKVQNRPEIAYTAPDFICHAPPGAWCDLRDWSGLDRPAARPNVSNPK
jgi:hypothetical protein